MLVQIARSRASREQLARQILVDTALPLSALIALMSMIVWAGIRTGLAPLCAHAQRWSRTARRTTWRRSSSMPRRSRCARWRKAINTLLAEVRESVNAQKRFISDAAHQLRTPLAGLKSQTELALQRDRRPAC